MNTELSTCNAGHDMVAFSYGISCPVCYETDKLQAKIDKLTKDLEEATS